MIYYIKHGQNLYFRTMKKEGNTCQISIKQYNTKTAEKIAKKMKKKEIEQVVLSKQVKKYNELVRALKNYDVTILDGKWLMQYMLKEIICYLSKKDKIKDCDEIAVLANDLTNEVKRNIEQITENYKKVRVVTNNLEKFKKIEKDLYENKGISIIITNNRKKALINSSLIVNFDFVQEIIDQYNINEKAIIINMSDNIKINKKRFCGFATTDYEVEFENDNFEKLNLENIMEKQIEFSLKEILEERIYNSIKEAQEYDTFDKIRNVIEKYNIQIKELVGMNGILE